MNNYEPHMTLIDSDGKTWLRMEPVDYAIHPTHGAYARRWETRPVTDWRLASL